MGGDRVRSRTAIEIPKKARACFNYKMRSQFCISCILDLILLGPVVCFFLAKVGGGGLETRNLQAH